MSTGLVANHCYSILSVHELTVKGKKVKILKLKNPYGGGSVWKVLGVQNHNFGLML